MRLYKIYVLIFLCILSKVAVATVNTDTPRYTIIDLGTLGGNNSYAYGINEVGQVTGVSYTENGNFHSFVWQDGMMTDLGTVQNGLHYTAQSINDSGKVVGYCDLDDGYMHSFIYDSPDGIKILEGRMARDINNHGQVIINSTNGTFIWKDSSMFSIPIGGIAINDYGQVAGTFDDYAVIYDTISGINVLGALEGDIQSVAYDINNLGEVVGLSEDNKGIHHAFLYDRNGDLLNLINDPDRYFSFAKAVNDNGYIVGASYTPEDQNDNGFLWINDMTYYLEDIISYDSDWTSLVPIDINNSDQIVGGGYINGEQHAFLMTYIPEPGTVSFFIFGYFVLIKRRCRRRLNNSQVRAT